MKIDEAIKRMRPSFPPCDQWIIKALEGARDCPNIPVSIGVHAEEEMKAIVGKLGIIDVRIDYDFKNEWSTITYVTDNKSNPYKIHPAGYYILVEVEPIEETHEGTKILMVQEERKREQGGRDVGRILEFGPICFKGYADCKVPEDWGCSLGDIVEFNRYDGKVPRLAENNPEMANLRIINDNDIIAVMGV